MSAISNAKWVAVSQVARIFSQLANIFVLARILPPSDYGVMAMATVVTNLALLLRDQGTSAALIQRENLSHQTITTVFWFNISLGIIIGIAIVICSPAISVYFKEPSLTAVLCSLAIIFPLGSSATSHQALLERNSQFKKLAIIEVVASLASMVVAIIAALNGLGVYSLVLQAVMTATLSSIMIWLASSWRPSGRPSFAELKLILPFTGHMAGFQLITYFFRNADSAVIGRVLGAASLGIYSIAYKVMLLPVQTITQASSRALYPIMSRQQSSLHEMGKLYLQTVSFIAFITAPLMAGVYALREPFVNVAFGHQWIAAANVLAWLAPIGFIQSISSTAGTIFMAQGKTKLLMWVSVFSSTVHVTAFVIGTRWGVEGVAMSYLVASALTTLPILHIAGSLVQCSLLDFLKALWKPTLISFVVCLLVRYLYENFNDLLINQYISFLIFVLFGVLAYLLMSFVFDRQRVQTYFSKIIKK